MAQGKIQFQQVIELLERVNDKPMLYIGLDLSRITPFLAGIRATCRIFDIVTGYGSIYAQVMKERGWIFSPKDPWDVLQESGLPERAIVTELIMIEIEVLKQYLRQLGDDQVCR